MANQIHVTLRPDGKWQVIRNNAEKASKLCETQAEAIEVAKGYRKNDPDATLYVHGKNGKIRTNW